MAITISNPSNLNIHYKETSVPRDTSTLRDFFTLPAGSTPIALLIGGEVGADPGGAGEIFLGKPGNTTYFTANANVKGTAGASMDFREMRNSLTTLEEDTKVVGRYQESGLASTTGGPWKVAILYSRK